MKVLIVEDESTSQRILENIFETQASIEIAHDGQEAFDKFSDAFEIEDPFDLICLDVHLPKASGLDFLAEVREFEESNGVVGSLGAKVIMITGDKEMGTVFAAMSQGCTSYLVKPLDPHKFHDELLRLGFIIS